MMPSTRRRVACCLLTAWILVAPSISPAQSQDEARRPKIGLALSGGGARGAAHIGVLKVLEELRIPVDYIAGTSAGAIMGGMYASGLSPEEMKHSLLSIDWNDILTDRPPRQELSFRQKQKDFTHLFALEFGVRDWELVLSKGFISGHKLSFYLRSVTLRSAGIKDFDRLPIPYRAVATDIENGEAVVLRHGELADAMRASMAVPGIFTPVEINGRLLVDGGMSSQLPVDVVRAMGADVVIVVNIGMPLYRRDELVSVVDISAQTLSFLTEKNAAEQLARMRPQDILIAPDLGEINSADFPRTAEIVAHGEAAARAKLAPLSHLALSPEAYARHLQRQRVVADRPIPIRAVQLAPPSRVSRKAVVRRLHTHAGHDLDLAVVQQDLTRIYDLGDFERVDFHLEGEGDAKDLTIVTREKSWGPNYLRFGLNLVDDFEGDSRFNLLADYTQTWINSLGAEWKNQVSIGRERRFFTEFYQPLDHSGRFFVAPRFQYLLDVQDIYEGDVRIAQYRTKTAGGGLDLGVQFGQGGEWRIGVTRDKVEAAPRVGSTNLPSFDIDQGAYVSNFVFDKLDNVRFPRRGYSFHTNIYLARAELGADADYDKLTAEWIRVISQGPHTLLGTLRIGSALGSNLPFYDNFRLGGFQELSGYLTGQLNGQYLGFARLTYLNLIGRVPATGSQVYVGGSLEIGNVWDQRDQMRLRDARNAASVFVGVDSVLGPVYVAYGYAEGGRNAFYLFLGKTF